MLGVCLYVCFFLCSRGADTSAVDDRGRAPKRLASRKEISNLLAAKETESKVTTQNLIIFGLYVHHKPYQITTFGEKKIYSIYIRSIYTKYIYT